MSLELERRVHAAFRPSPLKPAEIEALYVDFAPVRGDLHPAKRLASGIRTAAAGQPTCQLLAGHLGSGKSTELARLRRDLEADGKTYVITFTAEEELDLNDVDAPDLLLALARVICNDVSQREQISLSLSVLDSLWTRIWDGLKAKAAISSVKLKTSFMELPVDLKFSPDYRRMVREQIEPETTQLVEAVNDLIGQVLVTLGERLGIERLVLIVDDLEKLIDRLLPEAGCSQSENLFLRRAPQLTALRCHVVYALPLDLAYSHHEPVLGRRYGPIAVIPMVRIHSRPRSEPLDDGARLGRELLRAMVRHRLDRNDLAAEEVLSDGTLDELVLISGGQPDVLLNSIREAALVGPLPITLDAVAKVALQWRRTYARMLRLDHTPVLEMARDQADVTTTKAANESVWRQLVRSRAILLYQNGEEWCDLNPALDGVDFPQPRPAADTP